MHFHVHYHFPRKRSKKIMHSIEELQGKVAELTAEQTAARVREDARLAAEKVKEAALQVQFDAVQAELDELKQNSGVPDETFDALQTLVDAAKSEALPEAPASGETEVPIGPQ